MRRKRERKRGAWRGCGTGVGEESRFVRGGIRDGDGDGGHGGSAAAGKGDGGDRRERARSGDERVALPLRRVPGCATLAAQARCVASCHRLPLLSQVAGAGCRRPERGSGGADCVLCFVADETTTPK